MTIYTQHKFIILLLAIFSSSFLFGQKIDTLKKVQALNKSLQYNESLKLLKVYRKERKNELYGDWLYAHTLHLNGQFAKSQHEYYALETRHPYNYDIKIDRINKVIENGRINKAIDQLKNIEHQLPKDYNFVAHKLMAQLFYWKGDYDEADKEIEKALYLYIDEKSALALKKEISRARSNWANFNLGYFTDNQPLDIFTPEVIASFYVNSMTTVGARLSYPIYLFDNSTYTTPWLAVFSQLNFIESKIGVKVGVGAIAYTSKENSLTGEVKIKKQFSKYTNVVLDAELAPYLSTTFTIPNKLMQTHYGINYNYNNPKGFIGKASFSINQFPTLDNSYYTASGWLVSPPLSLAKIDLRIGYGINYSDGQENNFTAVESLDTILTNWDSTYVIEGTYNPFFSPSNQLIHSAVGMIKYTANEDLNFGIDINYGFSASTDAPYLFLDEGTNNETTIGRKFSKTTYNPLDINTYVNYTLSEDTSLKIFYKYQKTSYYESNYAGISSRIIF